MPRSVLWLVAVAAVGAGSLLVFLSVRSSLEVPARVVAAREWMLLGGVADDRLTAVQRDNRTGLAQGLTSYVFDRGDDVTLALRDGIADGAVIGAGDTLGRLRSAVLEERLAGLAAQLGAARAELELKRSSDKDAVVTAAQRRLEAQQERSRQQRARLARLRSLHDSDLVSGEALEEAEHLLALELMEEEVAQAELLAVQTGSTPSDLALSQALVDGLERQRELLERRRAAQVLIAPFAGQVAGFWAADTLLAVRDTTQWLAHLLVPTSASRWLEHGQSVALSVAGQQEAIEGSIEHIATRRHIADRRQRVLAVATLHTRAALLHGSLGQAVVRLPAVPLWRYVLGVLETQ